MKQYTNLDMVCVFQATCQLDKCVFSIYAQAAKSACKYSDCSLGEQNWVCIFANGLQKASDTILSSSWIVLVTMPTCVIPTYIIS